MLGRMATRRVYKYGFAIEDDVTITMPQGAEILHVAAQGPDACVWARVDPDAAPEKRQFRLAGTGHDLPDTVRPDGYPALAHVGSFLMAGGALVFHLFEVTG
jgi:hypothetical protein